jgi:hypothetical protein
VQVLTAHSSVMSQRLIEHMKAKRAREEEAAVAAAIRAGKPPPVKRKEDSSASNGTQNPTDAPPRKRSRFIEVRPLLQQQFFKVCANREH